MKGESGINKDLTKKVGFNVQNLRETIGLTREELAEKCDLSPQNLAKIESGERFFSSGTLARLASALGVKVSEIFLEDESSKKDSPFLIKIERLLKGRSVDDVEFAHGLLCMIFKRIPKK